MNIKKAVPLLAVCVALCMSLFALVGCGASTPAQCADTFFKSIKENNTDALAKLYTGDNVSEDINGLLSFLEEEDSNGENTDSISKENIQKLTTMIADFDYKIGDASEDGDTATVQVTLTTYNLGDAFSDFYKDFLDQAMTLALKGGNDEEITSLSNKILAEKLETCKKDCTATISLPMTKVNGSWKVNDLSDNDEVADAFSGKLLSAMNNTNE